jgi:predicted MFS family arabinose efflux permease
MSLIGDYHGRDTRSRAMALHQSSVYAGSIAGGGVSGWMGQSYGWRSSFMLFGALGVCLAVLLWGMLREPVRGMSDEAFVPGQGSGRSGMLDAVVEILRNRMAVLLIVVFMGANFVAVVFLTWMPTFLYQKFHMSLSMAGLNGTAYLQIASVLGVISGGFLADAVVRRGGRWRGGGRMWTQAVGLLCGVPFLFLTGWTIAVPVLIVGMVGFGYFKGLYDANIWASLYDVVGVERRGVTAGMMNSLGWLGGGVAPIAIAVAASRYGMSACISATAAIYLLIGLLLLWGSFAARRRAI